VAALDELQRAGVAVPDDVVVTGWDDVMTARYTRPGLTSVTQPVRALGSLAATTLHRMITTGERQLTPTILPTRIVLRGSCGCPEAQPAATRSRPSPVREIPKEEEE